MAVVLRPQTAVLVLVAVLAVGVFGSSVAFPVDDERSTPEVDLVPVFETDTGAQTQLWPYTSHTASFERRTLAINLLVYGDPAFTRWYLTDIGRGEWNETLVSERDVAPAEDLDELNATTTPWRPADGANRYVFLRTGEGADHWLPERYQLHDGDYLGARYHLRAYTGVAAGQPWTAIQAHHEHWDWFHLRHTVDSTEDAQQYLEREFMDRAIVDRLYRTPIGNTDGSDSTGWVTVVEFYAIDPPISERIRPPIAGIPALLGVFIGLRRLVAVRSRASERIPAAWLRVGLLVVALVGLTLGVRFGAIVAERALPIPPKLLVVPFYPLLVVGLPALTHRFARPLDRSRAFAGASIGFITALLLDYTYLGVTVLPLEVVVHRGALAVALGFIAAGASSAERGAPDSHRRTGVVVWLAAVVLAVLRFVPVPV